VLAIVAAGLAGQAAQLLIQADWLPAQNALWDTSAWLPEDSLAGQLLYALLGYEATPTPLQAGIYFVTLLLPLVLLAIFAARRESPDAA
jgi:high-affinity iron transporter